MQMCYNMPVICGGEEVMICENVYCIYNRDDSCIFGDDVQLDIQGKCTSCIYVEIQPDELSRLKDEQLQDE